MAGRISRFLGICCSELDYILKLQNEKRVLWRGVAPPIFFLSPNGAGRIGALSMLRGPWDWHDCFFFVYFCFFFVLFFPSLLLFVVMCYEEVILSIMLLHSGFKQLSGHLLACDATIISLGYYKRLFEPGTNIISSYRGTTKKQI